jgi:putative (di)nucleoside polyphosphate hydrolase
VYQRALQELSRFLTWPANGGHTHERRHTARYLRQPHAPRAAAAVADTPANDCAPDPQLVLAPKE